MSHSLLSSIKLSNITQILYETKKKPLNWLENISSFGSNIIFFSQKKKKKTVSNNFDQSNISVVTISFSTKQNIEVGCYTK